MYIGIKNYYRGLAKLECWGLYKYLWVYKNSTLYNDGSFEYKKTSDRILKKIKRKR